MIEDFANFQPLIQLRNYVADCLSVFVYEGNCFIWEHDSDVQIENLPQYTIAKTEFKSVFEHSLSLIDGYGNARDIPAVKHIESGSGNTSSIAESSPISASIGNITTPTSKGNGANSYERNLRIEGGDERIKIIMDIIKNGNGFRDLIINSFKKYVYEYNTVE